MFGTIKASPAGDPMRSTLKSGEPVSPSDELAQHEMAAAKEVWEQLAVRARALHCPEHFMPPWKVVVIGDSREKLRLQIYGCCPRLQTLVTEVIRKDPRMSGPS
jgi:hypothetical protein